MVLVFLFFCIILFNFNPAQAICVPRNQSQLLLYPPPSSSSSKSQPTPSPPPPRTTPAPVSATSKSQPPPPPPPPPKTTPAPVSATTSKQQPSPSPPSRTTPAPVSDTTSKSQPPPSPPPPPPPPPPPKTTPTPVPATTSKQQPSPSPPSSTTPAPTSKPQPPASPPTPAQGTPGFPKIQISLPTGSLNVGVGVKTVTDPRIKSLCDKTDQPALCLATIAPFFNGKSDVISVIEMLIKAGTEQTKQAIATAEKMATDSKSDPRALSRFNDCKEIYDDALDNLQEAIDALAEKDVGTISTMISAAISDYGTCDDGFTGQPNPIPEGVSPMAKINENLMDIAGIILALANMIP